MSKDQENKRPRESVTFSPKVVESLKNRKNIEKAAEELRRNIFKQSKSLAKAFQEAFDEVLYNTDINEQNHESDLRKKFFELLSQKKLDSGSEKIARRLYEEMIDENQLYTQIKDDKPSLEPNSPKEKKTKFPDKTKNEVPTAKKDEPTAAKKKTKIFDEGVRRKNIGAIVKNVLTAAIVAAPFIALAFVFPPAAFAIPIIAGIYGASARREIKRNIKDFDMIERVTNLEKQLAEQSKERQQVVATEKDVSQDKTKEKVVNENEEKTPTKSESPRDNKKEDIASLEQPKKEFDSPAPGLLKRLFTAIKNLFTGKNQEKLRPGDSIAIPQEHTTNGVNSEFKSAIKNSDVKFSSEMPKILKPEAFEERKIRNETNKLDNPEKPPVVVSDMIKKAAQKLLKSSQLNSEYMVAKKDNSEKPPKQAKLAKMASRPPTSADSTPKVKQGTTNTKGTTTGR